jgi:hypothetical protein
MYTQSKFIGCPFLTKPCCKPKCMCPRQQRLHEHRKFSFSLVILRRTYTKLESLCFKTCLSLNSLNPAMNARKGIQHHVHLLSTNHDCKVKDLGILNLLGIRCLASTNDPHAQMKVREERPRTGCKWVQQPQSKQDHEMRRA